MISPNPADCNFLESSLDAEGWTIQGATSIREATRFVSERPSLIVCERDLSDGTWKDIFRQTRGQENPPPVVVVSRYADQSLWAEVFNLGGFDVLMRPFVRSEVSRVLAMACRQSAFAAA